MARGPRRGNEGGAAREIKALIREPPIARTLKSSDEQREKGKVRGEREGIEERNIIFRTIELHVNRTQGFFYLSGAARRVRSALEWSQGSNPPSSVESNRTQNSIHQKKKKFPL